MLPWKGLNRDVEVSFEFTQADATLTIVLSPNLQFAKNSILDWNGALSCLRHFQDTASEKVERLQHGHSPHKGELFKKELGTKRENGILAGILIASTYSGCNLHLSSQTAVFSISAFLSSAYSFYMTAACLAQSQVPAILSDRIRLHNTVTLICQGIFQVCGCPLEVGIARVQCYRSIPVRCDIIVILC